MQRRRFLATAAALAAAAPFTRLPAQPGPPAGNYRRLRNGVGYYTNRGGTIGHYLSPARDTGGVVVDSQFPAEARAFLETIEAADGRLDLLINTHHHGDHTGGNGIIAPLAADYVAHARAGRNLEETLSKNDKSGELPLPATTFAEEWSMVLPGGGETVTARHFGPAHTGGDAVVHFENANVAHLGDLLFNRRFPYIDVGAGGDVLNWIRVMKKIRKHYDRDTVFVFGHAAESYSVTGDRADVKSFEDYLKSLRDYVRRERKRGTTLEALRAKTVTIPGAPDWRYGERLRDLNLATMYAALE